MAEGKKNTEIAQALSISAGTVKHHMSSILAKLNIPQPHAGRGRGALPGAWSLISRGCRAPA